MQLDTTGFDTMRIDRAANAPVVIEVARAFTTPQLQQTLSVWHLRRGERALPSRRDLTIPDLKFALPHIAIIDIVQEAAQVRYKVRLMGGELDRFLSPMTGCYIDEAVPKYYADKWARAMRPATERRAPIRSLSRVEYRDQRCFVAEAFYAPLADDGGTPNKLLLAIYYHLIQSAGKSGGISGQLLDELDGSTRPPSVRT